MPLPSTPDRRTRGAQTLAALRGRVADGTWPVGSRLPGEHELAAELGVGRNTVREALRSLVNSGLLRARAGDGTYVIATDELEAALARRVGTREARFSLEVRSALEIEAARLAALRAEPAMLERLRRGLDARTAAAAQDDDVAFLRADLAWHDLVTEASGNQLLLELYQGLDRATSYARRPEAQAGADPHSALHRPAAEMDSAHEELMAALTAHDPAAAVLAARRISDASHRILDAVGAHLEPEETP